MPPVTEPITYDLDGNILTDGRWTYAWDAENRLTSMMCLAQASPLVPGYRLNFTYDGLSRRIAKKVEQQSTFGGAWSVVEYQGYLYDGWNCIMCVRLNNDATPTTPPTLRGRLASYVWGPDVGSSSVRGANWQRAGGVGGLLFVSQGTSINTYSGGPDPFYNDSYFPLWDRMGNLTGYRKASTVTTDSALATTGAMLEYDAFGRELRSSGPAADKIPFHFSSKFTDVETGLNYYGYRYYDAGNGRWLGRDPIGEVGGENLGEFVRNDGLRFVDFLGMDPVQIDVGIYDPANLGDSGSTQSLWSNVHRAGLAYDSQGNPQAATTMDGIETALKKALKSKGEECCTKTLTIASHGTPEIGGIVLGISGETRADLNSKADGEKLGAKIKKYMCAPCQINLLGCGALNSSSAGATGGEFGQGLASKSGCQVVGSPEAKGSGDQGRTGLYEEGGKHTGYKVMGGSDLIKINPDGTSSKIPGSSSGKRFPNVIIPGTK